MDQGFYEAVIPDPFTVLGVRLRPLSLGHLLILRKIGSAFFDPDAKPNLGELGVAVTICSKTYEDGLAFLDDPQAMEKLTRWGKRITNQTGAKGWFRRLYKPVNVIEAFEFFSKYLDEGLKSPSYTYEADKSKEINITNEQLVKVILLKNTNLTESEILNRPWSMCVWDMLTIRAIEGQIQFFDDTGFEEAKREANRVAKLLRERHSGNK